MFRIRGHVKKKSPCGSGYIIELTSQFSFQQGRSQDFMEKGGERLGGLEACLPENFKI